MTKKFKYKLEGLLKLRKFKEETLKVELGKINHAISIVKSEIDNLKNDITESYNTQEGILKGHVRSHMLGFYPGYIKGRKQVIDNKESLLYSLNKKYQKKLSELNQAMGETKLIANMKENEFNNFRKASLKKEQDNIEEMGLMRRKHGEKQW